MVRRCHHQKIKEKRRWRKVNREKLLENLMKNIVDINLKNNTKNNVNKNYCLKLDNNNCDYMGCNFINVIEKKYGVDSRELRHWKHKICLHPETQDMCDSYETKIK